MKEDTFDRLISTLETQGAVFNKTLEVTLEAVKAQKAKEEFLDAEEIGKILGKSKVTGAAVIQKINRKLKKQGKEYSQGMVLASNFYDAYRLEGER